MFLKQLDLTTALRPSYLPDEDLLFVQDNVGLYEGKYKLLNQQKGQVYLTSHRVCYVDKADPRKYSVSVDLKEVERYEFYAGFLKSSAKITLVPKPSRRSALHTRLNGGSSSPSRGSNGPQQQRVERDPTPMAVATWVCTICSFSNPLPSNFDPEALNAQTPLPPCLACGIQPTLTHVLKAVIASASNRPQLPVRSAADDSESWDDVLAPEPTKADSGDPAFPCPRCTFLNYPSLLSCEMCGAALVSEGLPAELTQLQLFREESPGPSVAASFSTQPGADSAQSVKLSFRGGGEKLFYERLKGAMAQRKWLLHNAPPVPSRSQGIVGGDGLTLLQTGSEQRARAKAAGIAGLEKRGLDMRKNTELVIGSAFEDLEALMASAKQVVALAETLARQSSSGSSSGTGTAAMADANSVLAESASQLGLVTTKDIVGGGGSARESLYLSELSRNLAEFLTDDARAVLRRAGGILTLVDLWAVFNRARGGVELVSPMDLLKAAQQWEKLRLPVRLRTFRSGVMVVQSRDRTDEATVKALVGWLRDLRDQREQEDQTDQTTTSWYWQEFGRGVNAQETARQFGWSIGVAEEELAMAEERGVLCREEGISGLRFWENFIDTGEYRSKRKAKARSHDEAVQRALRDAGLI
ncbi:vacuolar protein sorting protein [Grosmannia clavigera kw1407]|uniref:Vacuolar protein-sorting-associated protein 36 n=1 Tax=Grosmannia clavigera (strain kw1407 / UAMH 11150) TaxID=655863 RepID=F0X8F6_GROCL|nr:vacuolar protein sorting protein [Grosmannia clavigera kw1407]EFX06026.1 vacuolar protein sorting protein [Grosmannia clavigera kw1407]